MSKKSASRISARLTKSVSILALGASLAGCSSGTVRFSDGFYTGAIPKQSPSATQTAYPSTAANQPYQAPDYTPTDYGNNVVGQNVDDVYTGSVRTNSNVRREVLSAPQTPYPVRSANTPPAPVAAVPAKTKLAPVSTASAPVVKPVNPAVPAAKSGIDPMTTATVSKPAAPAGAARAEGWTAAGGTYVTMREGETVYNLAKRYGVPANAIMEANNISDPKSITAGKQVIIPTYVYSRTAPNSMPDNNIAVRSASSNVGGRTDIPLSQAPNPATRPARGSTAVVATQTTTPSASSSTTSGGKYVVASGDTLSRVASRTGSNVAAIKRLNGLTTDNIRIGQTLLIPGVAGNPTAENLATAAKTTDPVKTSSAPTQAAKAAPAGAISTIDASSTAKAPSDTGVASLRWPAKGRVVSAFGSNSGGKANDGIDISMPEGTSIKSAENGVVIYAGDGLKEFGKTVLIRHGNGLVTVYGNLQTINVKQGATVNRGQSLGLSGMSGNARQPQLHFEVRKNTSPVNPLEYLG